MRYTGISIPGFPQTELSGISQWFTPLEMDASPPYKQGEVPEQSWQGLTSPLEFLTGFTIVNAFEKEV